MNKENTEMVVHDDYRKVLVTYQGQQYQRLTRLKTDFTVWIREYSVKELLEGDGDDINVEAPLANTLEEVYQRVISGDIPTVKNEL